MKYLLRRKFTLKYNRARILVLGSVVSIPVRLGQLVHKPHRLVDMGRPIAAGVAEKPEHILRKPASRRASRGLVDATRGSPHHPQTGQLSYFLVSVGVVRGAWRFDDMCGLIPSPPLTAFPRRLY